MATFCTLKCNMWGPVWTLATCRSRSRSCSRRRTTRSFFSTTTTWRGCNFSSPWPIRPRSPRSLLKSDDYTMEDLAFALAYPSPYCETNIRGVKFIGGDKKNYSVPIDEYTVALQHIITKRGTTPLAVVHLMGGHLALEDCACSNADYLRYVHFLISMCHGRKVDEPYTNFLLPNGQPKFFVKPTNKLNTAPQTITIVYKKGLVFPPDSNAFGKARVAKTNEQVRGLGFPAEMTIDSSGRPDIARRISAWIVRPGMRLPHLCAICGLADHLDKDCKFGGDCPLNCGQKPRHSILVCPNLSHKCRHCQDFGHHEREHADNCSFVRLFSRKMTFGHFHCRLNRTFNEAFSLVVGGSNEKPEYLPYDGEDPTLQTLLERDLRFQGIVEG